MMLLQNAACATVTSSACCTCESCHHL